MAFTLPAGRRIAIAGAGSIGGYAGGCLALAGLPVTLLLRPALATALAGGLHLSDLDGVDRVLSPDALHLQTEPAIAFADAGLILVTVKATDTDAMAALIATHAPADALIVSLQNGIGNADRLKAHLPGRQVLAGMVPFNVARPTESHFHRATTGEVMIADIVPGLAEMLNVPGWKVIAHPDMVSVQWGKLLLNLNNALNALSGLPLAQQLGDRRWRRLLAAQQRETLTLLRQAGIRPARLGRISPTWLPFLLDLPDFLFRRLAGAMLRIDPLARSSMWEDLQKHRPTEIDALQGYVLALADKLGGEAPVCRRVHTLIKQAEFSGQGIPHMSVTLV